MRENSGLAASPSTALAPNIAMRGSARSLMLALAVAVGGAAPSAAQTTGAPAATPHLPSGPLGATFDARTLLVTSAANEHGSILWVVDSIQHNVVLCEKLENAKDFTCVKKPLP